MHEEPAAAMAVHRVEEVMAHRDDLGVIESRRVLGDRRDDSRAHRRRRGLRGARGAEHDNSCTHARENNAAPKRKPRVTSGETSRAGENRPAVVGAGPGYVVTA